MHSLVFLAFALSFLLWSLFMSHNKMRKIYFISLFLMFSPLKHKLIVMLWLKLGLGLGLKNLFVIHIDIYSDRVSHSLTRLYSWVSTLLYKCWSVGHNCLSATKALFMPSLLVPNITLYTILTLTLSWVHLILYQWMNTCYEWMAHKLQDIANTTCLHMMALLSPKQYYKCLIIT